jgi:hypothetical protein
VFALAGAAFVFAGVSTCAGAAAGLATGAAGEACGCAVSSAEPSTTERVPVTNGNESARAVSMKAAAAPMVNFASNVCVPRGPNAVLETLLEKSAPASAFPGCNSTAMMSTMHDRIKIAYKT